MKIGAPDPRDAPPPGPVAARKPLQRGEAGGTWWALKPVERPDVPAGFTESANPIDAFVAAEYRAKGLTPVGRADRPTLLRRVYLDLIGIPPTPAEQEAFLNDTSPDAYERVVDRLLASEQHGVRYARHWLDVLRYADADERMIAAPGIYLWRDWVINALNDDVPYDQFVRAQLTGYRSTERTQMSATGYRSKAEPRPDDLFALGLLRAGPCVRDGKGDGELAISAVETVSTAFMGLTVGLRQVPQPHVRPDHAARLLCDEGAVRSAGPAQGHAGDAPPNWSPAGGPRRKPPTGGRRVEAAIDALVGPYRKKLYDDRVAMLPDDVQAIILKPETRAHRRGAEDRRRLFPGPADRRRTKSRR